VRLLLDTHALLWWSHEPNRLAARAKEAIANAENDVFVSVVSAWELAIKAALGRVRFPGNLEAELDRHGFQKLGISFAHAQQIGSLPSHHRDPFDRMLIAQARSESLTLVTRDRYLGHYGITILPA
jgi:PIN domain nuclease of toxin-antitoxin system